ncbi:MAG: gliding motility-associated-like protein [Bacteroidia bacterium]
MEHGRRRTWRLCLHGLTRQNDNRVIPCRETRVLRRSPCSNPIKKRQPSTNLNMKKYLLLFLLLGFGNSAFAARPTWEADLASNSSLPNTSMTIVAQLDIMGTTSDDVQDLVAAFVGGQLRGVGIPDNFVNATVGTVAQFQVYGNPGEVFTFKYYDNSADVEYTAVNPAITFATNSTIGSANNPLLITANNYPTDISLSNSTVAENLSTNTTVGAFNTADLDGGDTFTYSFATGTGSTNNTSFSIDGNQLKTAEMFNFESKSFYTIRVKVTDSQGGTFEEAFTISITNANDPITNIAISDTILQENKPTGTIVGTFTSTDEDSGNTQSYTLDNTGGLGTDNGSFIIEGTSLKSNEIANYELKKNYQIQVKGSDGAGSTFFKQFSIAITDANDAPDSIQISSNTILENLAVNNSVGNLITFDQDTFDTHTYTFYESGNTNDNADFMIQSGNQIFSNATFDYETDSLKELDIRSTDNNGLSVERRITIKVLNQNDAPTNLELSANSVDENLETGAFVGEFTAVDEDAFGNFTYSLIAGTGSTNNASFQIVDDTLKTNEKFDFETKDNYSIRVQVQDLDGGSAERIFSITINNANDTTTDIQLSSLIVEENKFVGTTVGAFSSTDQDVSDNFTYSLMAGVGDADNLAFKTVGSQLLTDSIFDFERKKTYQIRVKSTDAGGLFFEKAFTISIQNVNDAPTKINYTSKSIEENQAIGTSVGTLSTEDQDVSDSHIYSIVGGTGQAFFLIENALVKTNQLLDFESDSLYTLSIQTRDANGLTYAQTDTIKIIDINDSPTDIAISENRVFENLPVGTGFGKFSARDVDAKMQNFSYSLVAGTGSDDNGNFLIVGDSLKTDVVFDFETKADYSIRVRVNDGFGGSYEESLAISIRDANDAPTNIIVDNLTVNENAPIATLVGTISTTDQDASDSFTYTLVAGVGGTNNTAFRIAGNQLQTDSVFDFETKATYSVRIRTMDANGLSFEKSFLIAIQDVNDAPTKINYTSKMVEENQAIGTTVVTLSTEDQDAGDSHIYSIVGGTGQAIFLIENKLVKTNQMLDFESDSLYTLSIQTRDANGLTYTQTDTIKVVDINDSPTDIALSENRVFENMPIGTGFGKFSASDVDAKTQNFSYSLVAGTGSDDNGNFIIVGDSLKTDVVFDFETKDTYSIRVQVNDGFGGSYEESLAITIRDANDAPTNITVSNLTVNENAPIATLVGTISTTDQDVSDSFTYTLVAGTGSANNTAFAIVDNRLLTDSIFDFESKASYFVRVRTTDGAGAFFERAFQILVQDVNDKPTKIYYSSKTIEENQVKNTEVGMLSSEDQDAGDSHTYSIVGGSGQGIFIIENNVLRTNAILDFESDSSYTLLIETEDLAGMTYRQTDTINVIDINDSPTDIDLSKNTVSENLPVKTMVGLLTSVDEDAKMQNFTYSLVAGTGAINNASFQIADDTLQTNELFDFENKSDYSVRIRVNDGFGGSYEEVFAITIRDANDAPTDLQLSTGIVAENQLVGTAVGDFTTVDQDVGDNFAYTFVTGMGDEGNAAFTIVGNKLVTDSIYNFEFQNSYSIRVRTTDADGLFFEKSFTITIQDANDTPTKILYTSKSVEENKPKRTTVGTLSSVDEDVSDSHTYRIVGGTGQAIFVIENDLLKTDEVLDYEFDSIYTLLIETTDVAGTSFTQTDSIKVIDVNDPPTDIVLISNEVSENLPIGSAVSNLEIRDSDAPIQSFIFELASGLNDTDNANFSIENDTLRTAVVFNFEQKSVYNIRLKVTDDQGGIFEKPFNITILDENDEPTNISLSIHSIQENELANATVGDFSTTDEDVADTFTYTFESGLGGEDNASFAINDNQLQQVFPLNYESDSSLNILVKSTDSGGLSFTKAFTIKVIDQNEKPILEDATFEVQEFAENGAVLGQMIFSDVDFNQSFSFVGFGDTNPFAINSTTGEITLSNKDEIDYEEETSYQFQVIISDSGTPVLRDTATVIINVVDEIEEVLPVSNFVSPNNDGKNDFWAINTPDLYQGYELIIYDANGQDVYKSSNYQNEWNGQDNSNGELPSGVYFYTFRKPGTQFSYKGSIHLVRSGR